MAYTLITDAGVATGSNTSGDKSSVASKADALGVGAVATDTIWNAKGDLAVGTASDTAAILTVGTNNFVLTADSSQSTGLKWAAAGGVSDGDKGDITVSASGATFTIDNDVVTYAKMQNVSATDKILGRSTSGVGDVEEIACTLAGRNLIDDADASAQRTTLGLGTLATQSGTFSGTSSGTNTGDQTISDATITTSDITTNNFTTAKHGFVPKGTNIGNYLKDDGTWAAVTGGSGLTHPQIMARLSIGF